MIPGRAGEAHSAGDCALLVESGLFDEAFYRVRARLPAGADAVRHYLELGWHWGLQPAADFDSAFVQPFYEAAGLHGPPLMIWVELSALGGRLPCTEGEAQWRAERVRPSPVFDAAWYATRLPPGMDPALHYVLVGERLGWRPSDQFDPAFYIDRYPEIPALGLSPLMHFEHSGRQEGRRPRAALDRLTFPGLPASGKPRVLMLVHDGSRTGAPLLGWSIARLLAARYDVVSVLLRGGELEAEFAGISAAVVGPMAWEEWHVTEMSRVADRLVEEYRPLYAVANGIETSMLVPPLAMRGVPSVALVHEFAAYTRPMEKLSNAFDWATEVVFPANIVAESSYQSFPHLRERRGFHVFAQGRVDPPAPQAGPAPQAPDVGAAVRPAGARDAFVVLGAGSVQIRKGVDIFFSVAAAVRRIAPALDVRFAWIGDGYDPVKDPLYSAYLKEQFDRAGLAGMVAMLEPVPNLDPAYAAADVMLMSSRLDPQPNVGIDAVVRGLPVVCFEGASGTAEVLARDPETAVLVAPHLDAHGAAEIICRLAGDRAALARLGLAVQRVGRHAYDMAAYIARVDGMGQAAAALLREEDRQLLTSSGVLDADLVLPPGAVAPGLDGLANVVLQQWAVVGLSPGQTANPQFRRPCAGFHPQAYAAAHPEVAGQNPLAHWLRAGRPAGPWSRTVFAPLPEAAPTPLRVALHAHFYHTDSARDLASRLRANATPCDLFVTTDLAAKADRLRLAFAQHAGAVDIAIVPNRGRDIGPFLACLPDLMGYDVVGHLHGKRSQATDADMGDRWREFLWENLAGGEHPMLDTAAQAFAANPGLGLLMAEDPHLVGWDGNRELAESLAERMGLPGTLDTFFDFPLGTMFWARPAALRPLLGLRLGWDDYPPEPVAYDGTILHALERVVPFVVRSTGATLGGLRVPGTSW